MEPCLEGCRTSYRANVRVEFYPRETRITSDHPLGLAGRPRRRQRKNAVFVLQSSFSNDLCAHVADVRRASWLGSILRFSEFEIFDFEIFGCLGNHPTTLAFRNKLWAPSFDEVSNGHGNHLPPRAPRDSQKDSIRSPQRARMHPPNFKGAVTRDDEGKASAWRRRGHPSFSYGRDTSILADSGGGGTEEDER